MEQVRAAKAVCARCPVAELCLATFGALVEHGVVGGMTAGERRLWRRERRRRPASPGEAAA